MHTQLVAAREKTTLAADRNPLLAGDVLESCGAGEIETNCVLVRAKASGRRELRDLRRAESAAAAIAGLTQTNELYGFTKGQFSLLDLIIAALKKTGPARFFISTWTAARHEIIKLSDLAAAGELLSCRWLIDFTFSRRDPEAANQIRQTFGLDAIRVSQNHAKFCLFENDHWRLVLRSSMNLNMNPRFEDFTIANDPPLADFLQSIIREIWTKQKRSLQKATAAEQRTFFRDEL